MANVTVLDMDERARRAASCARTPSACSRRRASRAGTSAGAVDKTEWVQQIRTLTTLFPPYQLQEDAHPNYWGQLALRNCFRQAYNGGAPRGGTCSRGTGLNAQGRAEHDARRVRRLAVAAVLLFAGLCARADAAAPKLHRCGGAVCGSIERPLRHTGARSTSRSAGTAPKDAIGPPLVAVEGGPGYPSTGSRVRVPRDLRAAAARRAGCCSSTTAGRAGRR